MDLADHFHRSRNTKLAARAYHHDYEKKEKFAHD
jgi:hypothetical protein